MSSRCATVAVRGCQRTRSRLGLQPRSTGVAVTVRYVLPVNAAVDRSGCSSSSWRWSPVARVLAASACSSSSCCRVLILSPMVMPRRVLPIGDSESCSTGPVWQQNDASTADDVAGLRVGTQPSRTAQPYRRCPRGAGTRRRSRLSAFTQFRRVALRLGHKSGHRPRAGTPWTPARWQARPTPEPTSAARSGAAALPAWRSYRTTGALVDASVTATHQLNYPNRSSANRLCLRTALAETFPNSPEKIFWLHRLHVTRMPTPVASKHLGRHQAGRVSAVAPCSVGSHERAGDDG
jgi:hypothetical protein